jgi:hydrogenase nickel incorporation protein HypB
MCSVCGCGQATLEHVHDHGHPHDHAHDHVSHGEGLADFGAGSARVHVPGLSQERIISIERGILSKNDQLARDNRRAFAARGVLALNVVSSPGSGKTSLLVKAIERLRSREEVAVIEGDQQTSNDAERIRAAGAPALQINTGKGCHLDAHMVAQAFKTLRVAPGAVLFIENVGNLVCPAAFDLGEAKRIVVLSTTEGEDKPLKYPSIFFKSELLILNKVDLLPYVPFDIEDAVDNARMVHPGMEVIRLSCLTGHGLNEWSSWLEQRRYALLKQKAVTVA